MQDKHAHSGGGSGPHEATAAPRLSALVVAHNEAHQLADCLARLRFADEIVVVLDKCTDASKEVAARFTGRIVEGSWEIEGERRNLGIAACRAAWILEVDADERVPRALAEEIRRVVAAPAGDWYLIPVDHYIGTRLVRHGWGAWFGKAAYAGLFRKGAKVWAPQRVHPVVRLTGRAGGRLRNRLEHHVDRDISDMIQRLDRYTTARARDLRESGHHESLARNVRRLVTRFFKCYVQRQGYREGGYGFLIALCAGLYPLLSHLKATLEDDGPGGTAACSRGEGGGGGRQRDLGPVGE
jgi:glycosyltransferase involved in cell wall biosynthesis